MLYRTDELRNIGERFDKHCQPSRELLNSLSSFNLLRGTSSRIHYCKVLVKKVTGESNQRVLCFLSDFFHVLRDDLFILKESFDKNSIVCQIKFADFNNYINFENVVLPHNLTLLNRVNQQYRVNHYNLTFPNRVNNRHYVKSSVNLNSLVNIKLGNCNNSCDSDSNSHISPFNDLQSIYLWPITSRLTVHGHHRCRLFDNLLYVFVIACCLIRGCILC